MHVRNSLFSNLVVAGCAAFWGICGLSAGKDLPRQQTAAAELPAVLWTEPRDIGSRDLRFGPRGPGSSPSGEFTFLNEDLGGSTPKMLVEDRSGVKWKIKLGSEAQPETAASRIVWAVGYYSDEDYFLPRLRVHGLPARLHRGRKLIDPGGWIRNARLERKDPREKKLGAWRWRSNVFTGAREFNGLRVLMAVINNWDLKDVNNAVYLVNGRRVYAVSDLGASFGCPGRCWPRSGDKGELDKYVASPFIRRATADIVDFQAPARPSWLYAINPIGYLRRLRLEWIGRGIPRADARWMGSLLASLSSRQLRDAFLASGYSRAEADDFRAALTERIAALNAL